MEEAKVVDDTTRLGRPVRSPHPHPPYKQFTGLVPGKELGHGAGAALRVGGRPYAVPQLLVQGVAHRHLHHSLFEGCRGLHERRGREGRGGKGGGSV